MRSHVWKLLTAVSILVLLTSVLAACGPTPQPETVQEVVTQVVKETVIVEGTPQIVEKVVTEVVETEVEVVVTATPEPEPEMVSPGADTLVFNLDQVIQGGLDASQTIDSTSKKAAFHVSETLVVFDEEANDVKPMLATSWEALDDGLTYIFHLREGVKFHDGTDFNADAVVASLMRIYDENHPLHDTGEFRYASFIPIQSVEKVDDYTVKITATRQDPIFLWRMTTEPGYIQSPTAIEKWGEEYTNHPAGTGPFKVVEFTDRTGATMERFEDYWGEKPSYKTLIFKVNPDGQSKVADLLAGNVDVITRPPADQIAVLQNTPGIKVEVHPLRWLGYINLVTAHPPLDDVLVRRAVNYGFDRETLSNVFNLGISSQPLYTVWTEGAYAYEPNVTTYPYDPEKARSLLEEAGWTLPEGGTIREKNGVPLEVRLAQAGDLYGPEQPIPELFQSNMRDIGMSVKIVKIDPAMFWDTKVGAWNPDTAEATVFGWIAFLPDPIFVFDRFTSMYFPTDGYNMTWWSNPRVDELYKLAEAEMDLDKRAEYMKEIQRIVMEEVPTVHHSIVTLPLAFNERVSGIKVRGNVTVDLTGVTIAP